MELKKDAYGQEVWAHLTGKKSYEVVERDDGFVDLSGGAPAYFQDFKDWPKHEKEAIMILTKPMIRCTSHIINSTKKGVECLDNSELESDSETILATGLITYLFQKKK